MNTLLPIFLILCIVIWFVSLIDIARQPIRNPWIKSLYLLLILGVPLAGSLIYLSTKSHFRGEPRKFEPTFNR